MQEGAHYDGDDKRRGDGSQAYLLIFEAPKPIPRADAKEKRHGRICAAHLDEPVHKSHFYSPLLFFIFIHICWKYICCAAKDMGRQLDLSISINADKIMIYLPGEAKNLPL